MFSIIIPLYNKAASFGKTILSLQQQDYGEFEVIIVDDGSKDNSLEIARSIDDPRFHVYAKENEGVSIARNYGVQYAKNEFVIFLDADDELSPSFLKKMKSAIEKYPEESFFSASYALSDNGNVEYIRYYEGMEPVVIKDYCKTFLEKRTALCCVGSTCVRKSELVAAGMFSPGVKRGEDHDLWLRLACKHSLVYVPEPYLQYNLDSCNNSRGKYGSHKNSFPYWKWFDYDYPNRKALTLYTDYFILGNMKSAIKGGVWKSVFYWCKHLMFYNTRFILQRVLNFFR